MEQVTELHFNDGSKSIYLYMFPPDQRAEGIATPFGIEIRLHYGDETSGVVVSDCFPWHRIALYRKTDDYRKPVVSEEAEESPETEIDNTD